MFTYFRERKYDIICLQETYITKDVSEGWEKECGGKLIYNECTSHSSGQVILFRNGVTISEVNIVYNSRRILITKFEMVSNQIAAVNVYAPAGSQEKKNLFLTNLPVLLKILTWIIFQSVETLTVSLKK